MTKGEPTTATRPPSVSLFSASSKRHVLTVSELTGLVRTTLETGFPDVWLEGEISNLRAPASGHLYLTLKDASSQIRAVLFKSTAFRVRFALEDGLHVVARGRVTVYEPRGEYQLILEQVEPKGIGALQLAFEQVKARLEAEGLFDPDRKRPLPPWPRAVGVVTSLTGAVVRDMLTVLHRRCPTLRIVLVPVPVQGDGAAEQIAAAVRMLSESGLVDVMIVGRGGGSLEDLWSFNEEVVVRAIAASRIPVVSAVGHETDVTLADFAADLRAPTPSAAAEAVAPLLAQAVSRLAELHERLQQAACRHVEQEQQRLRWLMQHLSGVRYRVQTEAQRVDTALFGLTTVMREAVQRALERVRRAERALMAGSPERTVRTGLVLLPQLETRLRRSMQGSVWQRMERVQACAGRLHPLSPLATLSRGYSILQRVPTGEVLRSVEAVAPGDEVEARMSDGRVWCTVTAVTPDSPV